MPHSKPNIIVSRCLGFDACRYDGQMLHDDLINRLKPFADITTVCPEADIGMGTPRDPVRLVKGGQRVMMIQPSSGIDFSERMQHYSLQTLQSLHDVDGFILKSRSPSCGPAGVKVYYSLAAGAQSDQGAGLFAAAVRAHLPFVPVEDEGRLTNFHLREFFLMRVFAFARLRELRNTPSASALSTFHARHKLMMMCFNQNMMRQCGRIASNSDGLPIAQSVAQYSELFQRTLMQEASMGNIVNAVFHGFGWLSEGLSSAEKSLFIDAVEEYRRQRATLATLLHLLKSYVVRFDHDYLGSQYLLEPYPRPLFDLADSARSR